MNERWDSNQVNPVGRTANTRSLHSAAARKGHSHQLPGRFGPAQHFSSDRLARVFIMAVSSFLEDSSLILTEKPFHLSPVLALTAVCGTFVIPAEFLAQQRFRSIALFRVLAGILQGLSSIAHFLTLTPIHFAN